MGESKQSLAEQAYRAILDLISQGELKPGELVSHRILAERLGTSKQPICIALQHLEEDGVVRSVPRVGTQVAVVTADDMWGMLQWRIALESRTIVLASRWATEEQRRELMALAERLDAKIAAGESSLQDEMEFHNLLGNMSACERLRRELRKLHIFYLKASICELVALSHRGSSHVIKISHVDLVNAMVSEHADLNEMMEEHISSSTDMREFTKWYLETRLQKARTEA